MKYKVLICDDSPELAAEWSRSVASVASAEVYEILSPPNNEQINDAIKVLLSRRNAIRNDQDFSDESCLFDDVDILFVDYDLLHIDEDNARYTGEGVARLARCYSNCPVIIVLNQYQEAQFDLSLQGHLISHADLNIDVELISSPGLWNAPPWAGFRPWHWEVLNNIVKRQREITKEVEKLLDQRIVDFLGMHDQAVERLSDSAFGFIAPQAKSTAEFGAQTIRSFIEHSMDKRDSPALLRRSPELATRYACSRISKWLERAVLGPQDVLVDIPHLIQRFPFLIKGDMKDIDCWNAAIHNPDLLNQIPQDCRFGPQDWISRPAFWWHRLEINEELRAQRDELNYAAVPDFVFLEDISKFDLFTEAKEFRAGFHNQFDGRFVKPITNIRYAPQRRFAFGE